MSARHRIHCLAAVVGLAWASGCVEASASDPTTEWGATLDFADGTLRSFHTYDESGTLAIGVRVSAGALQNMPTEPSDGQHDVEDGDAVILPCCGHELRLPMPARASAQTPFEHIVLNYNPLGHGPPDVYDQPHIDFHFYMISDDERVGIAGSTDAAQICTDISTVNPMFPPVPVPMTCEQVALTAQDLPADQLPPNYVNVGAVEPAMGNHLVDPGAPEFGGELFTQTFVYGSHAGELVFMEPMITVARLLAITELECVDIEMPAAFPEAGRYPTQYCLDYDEAEDAYDVWLQEFEDFPASS